MSAALKRIAPDGARRAYRALRNTRLGRRVALRHGAAQLARAGASAHGDVRELCERVWGLNDFRPLQVRSEAEALLEHVKLLAPETVCEIGTANGGTTFLLAQASAPNAFVVTLDLRLEPARARAVPLLGGAKRRVLCLEGDSHREETRRELERRLGGRSLDLLFIDGDHSYAGISRDFELYSPLVRHGGLIVFHDIVPGTSGDPHRDPGDVWAFWRELKEGRAEADFTELVESWSQGGYGIGLLRKSTG